MSEAFIHMRLDMNRHYSDPPRVPTPDGETLSAAPISGWLNKFEATCELSYFKNDDESIAARVRQRDFLAAKLTEVERLRSDLATARAETLEARHDLLSVYERAFGIIANVSGGDWSKQSATWQRAAEAFRGAYDRQLAARPRESPVSPRAF